MKDHVIKIINDGPYTGNGAMIILEHMKFNIFWMIIFFIISSLFFIGASLYKTHHIRNVFDRYKAENSKIFILYCGFICILIFSYFLYQAGRAYFVPHLVLIDKLSE